MQSSRMKHRVTFPPQALSFSLTNTHTYINTQSLSSWHAPRCIYRWDVLPEVNPPHHKRVTGPVKEMVNVSSLPGLLKLVQG